MCGIWISRHRHRHRPQTTADRGSKPTRCMPDAASGCLTESGQADCSWAWNNACVSVQLYLWLLSCFICAAMHHKRVHTHAHMTRACSATRPNPVLLPAGTFDKTAANNCSMLVLAYILQQMSDREIVQYIILVIAFSNLIYIFVASFNACHLLKNPVEIWVESPLPVKWCCKSAAHFHDPELSCI